MTGFADGRSRVSEQRVVLMGLRGSGKTTAGRSLASRLRWRFVDLDEEVAARSEESSIVDIFANRGEAYFRTLELEVLLDVLATGDAAVIALGGGTPTAPGAAEALRAAAEEDRTTLIYLRYPPRVLVSRLSKEGGTDDRPALLGEDVVGEVQAVYEARDPLYVELANEPGSGLIEPGDGATVEEVVESMCAFLD